jgi:hypothetical protein
MTRIRRYLLSPYTAEQRAVPPVSSGTVADRLAGLPSEDFAGPTPTRSNRPPASDQLFPVTPPRPRPPIAWFLF